MVDKFLKPVDTKIVLSKEAEAFLNLNELLIFPHGMDGLHIWEAGIVLARFVLFNREIFQGKSVLELGSGVGIAGLAAVKYTESTKVLLTDYKQEILTNIGKNIVKNSINHVHDAKAQFSSCCLCGSKRAEARYLDWSEHKKFSEEYDIIIGSDLIYSGTPLQELSLLIRKAIKIGGKAYILIPNQRFMAPVFLKEFETLKNFKWEKLELNESKYTQTPLETDDVGYKTYPGLKELEFSVYIFEKTEADQEPLSKDF